MTVPGWIRRSLHWLTVGVVATFGVAGALVVAVVPYRFWDSLAFGAWSRSIAETGSIWSGSNSLNVSRPLFYVPQGLLWRFVTEDEWIGRLLSLAFAAVLVGAVWLLARQLAAETAARVFLPALAVTALLSSAVLAAYAAAGMTDVPVAAASAATAVALWSSSRPSVLAFVALGTGATVLAKPSGLLALAGLALATIALRRRESILGLASAAVGVALALAYDAWQAERLNVGLVNLLRAGNDDFWLERGDAVRWEVLASGGWLGDGARPLVLYGLAFAVARALGAGARVALAVAAVVGLGWSALGPIASGEGLGYPFTGPPLGTMAWLALAVAAAGAPLLAGEDPLTRRTYVALLLWVAPTALVWVSQRPDEARLLAPAWPALALLSGAALTCVSAALLRRRGALSLVPTVAVAAIALANVVSVDGLGRDGWRSLLELGPSGWADTAEMENFAYGPFSYHLNLARENVGSDDRIVSSDGRLAYFFPGRVEVTYARTCSDVEDARFFSLLTAGESLELAELGRQPIDPIGWMQCRRPLLELVGEQPGIYAAFVVGGPPARKSTAVDCHIAAGAGELVDAVFATGSYGEVARTARRALELGFEGTRVERTGCSTFRAVVTGIPDDPVVQEDFRRQARGVGLHVAYARAERFPEVSTEIPPVSP